MDGIILLNKPKGITSHDLVGQVRRAINLKTVGHTGTLDPMAEGLMIITVGKATKVFSFLNHHYKEYIACMEFGYQTDTLDATGNIVNRQDINPFSQNQVIEVLNSFLGTSKQQVPMYSAKKVNGRHLYQMARENIEVERAKIDIDIKDIELLQCDENMIKYRVVVSTGTYIRVLCQDIAAKLNNLATMTYLQRTKIDKHSLNDAHSIEDLNNNDFKLLSTYDILDDYEYYEYENISDVLNGKKIKIDAKDELVMITNNNAIYACYQRCDDGFYRCKRGLF